MDLQCIKIHLKYFRIVQIYINSFKHYLLNHNNYFNIYINSGSGYLPLTYKYLHYFNNNYFLLYPFYSSQSKLLNILLPIGSFKLFIKIYDSKNSMIQKYIIVILILIIIKINQIIVFHLKMKHKIILL